MMALWIDEEPMLLARLWREGPFGREEPPFVSVLSSGGPSVVIRGTSIEPARDDSSLESSFFPRRPRMRKEAPLPTPWPTAPTPLKGTPATPVTIRPGTEKVPDKVDVPCLV